LYLYYIAYVWQVPHPMVSVHNDGFMEYNKWWRWWWWCMCRHEYHSIALIISMACIWYQCVQWFCHLPSSDKTEETWRHLYPNLTLVLTWHDLDDRRLVGKRATCYSTFTLTSPPTSLLVTNEYTYIWNVYLHSCGVLCAVTCCFLHNVLRWCTGRIFKCQRSSKHSSINVIRSLIKPDIEPCLGISMQFRIVQKI
jgi:hypothetical protein